MFDKADDGVLLRGQAFGDEQGEGDQGVVSDELLHRLVEQGRVQAQVPEEKKGAAALVAVGERVVLDDEIEQVRRAAGRTVPSPRLWR